MFLNIRDRERERVVIYISFLSCNGNNINISLIPTQSYFSRFFDYNSVIMVPVSV